MGRTSRFRELINVRIEKNPKEIMYACLKEEYIKVAVGNEVNVGEVRISFTKEGLHISKVMFSHKTKCHLATGGRWSGS